MSKLAFVTDFGFHFPLRASGLAPVVAEWCVRQGDGRGSVNLKDCLRAVREGVKLFHPLCLSLGLSDTHS